MVGFGSINLDKLWSLIIYTVIKEDNFYLSNLWHHMLLSLLGTVCLEFRPLNFRTSTLSVSPSSGLLSRGTATSSLLKSEPSLCMTEPCSGVELAGITWEGDKQKSGFSVMLVETFDRLINLSCFPVVVLGIANTSV